MSLDPNEFDVTPIAVVDEFKMVDDDGTLAANIGGAFLESLVGRMNDREMKTGDLCPIVIGHTTDGTPEVDQPQIVGYAKNWRVDPLYNTGRKAAWCDAWIFKLNRVLIDGKEVILTASEVAKRWPRRSAEVWTRRREIDPISLLGATTPARDLGLMKLSRAGSLLFYSPGENQVNPQSPAIDAAAAAQSAPVEAKDAKLDQILALLTKLVDGMSAQAAPAGAPDAGAPAGAPGEPGEISDEELAELLGGGGEPEDESRKEDKPVQNAGYPGGMNTHVTGPQVKLSEELASVRNELARIKLQRTLSEIRETGVDVDPNDESLISDLAAVPEDIRARQLDRIRKLSRKAPVKESFNLENAIANSTDGTMKRMQTFEERQAVIKLARDKKITFEAAAIESGYAL